MYTPGLRINEGKLMAWQGIDCGNYQKGDVNKMGISE